MNNENIRLCSTRAYAMVQHVKVSAVKPEEVQFT